MPWSMVHFAIANQIFEKQVPPTFLLGSIAPDAVLIRENHKEGKIKSHFYYKENRPHEAFIEHYRLMTDITDKDLQYNYFILGYFSHIYSDIKWGQVKNDIESKFPIPSIRKLLWDEENQNDFNLFRNVEWKESTKSAVMNSPLYEITGIFATEELDIWRHKVFNWFDNDNNEPNIKRIYITDQIVTEFVSTISRELRGIFMKNDITL